MSHFTVGVILKRAEDLDKVLEPYSEGLKVAPYIDKTKEDIIAEAKKEYQTIIDNFPTIIEKLKEEGKDTSWHEENYAEALKFINATDEEIYQKNIYDYNIYNAQGDLMSTYNPNAKWDWYEIGGRWSQSLLIKDTVEDYIYEPPFSMSGFKKERPAPEGYRWVDGARIKDIEFDKMIEISNASEEATRFWEIIVEGAPLKDGEEMPFNLYNKEYYIERYKNKETYVKRRSMFSTYALLLPEGWIGQGDMGWWSMDNATYDSIETFYNKLESELKDPKNQDNYFIIVDCHI